MKLRSLLPLCAALSLALFGCEKKDDAGGAGEGAAKKGEAAQKKGAASGGKAAPTKLSAPAAFAQIPADTPYVIAGFEPMPQEVIDKVATALAPMLKMLDAELEKELQNLSGDSTEVKLQKAILEELKGNLNQAGLEKLGINTRPRFALYGLGVMPVMRVELKDPAAFKAMVARVEQKAGVKAPVLKQGEQEYWGFTEDGMTVAIAVVGNELIAGITPEKAAQDTLPLMLGQKAPAKSMTSGGVLMEVAKKHGFNPAFVGHIDFEGIARTVLGQGEGLNATVWTALAVPMEPLSDTCKTEIMGMVGNFPRMAMGYTKLTSTEWAAKYILETKPELAKALQGLAAPVPGVGSNEKAMFSIGLGVDIQKSIDFAKGKVAAIKAAPYKCEHLADLNRSVAQAEQALNQPLPPFVTNIKGFNVVLKDGDFTKGQPQAIKGYAMIRVDQPENLLAMAKGMAPQLAQLEVKNDGKPVALPAGLIPPIVDEPHVAMNDKGIAFSVGKGESANLSAALTAKTPAQPPLLAVGYDMGKFMGLMKAQMERSMQFMPPEMQAEQKAEMAMFDAVAGVFGMLSYSMHLTDAGIVFEQHMFLD